MDRKEFLKMCGLLGIAPLVGCSVSIDEKTQSPSPGKVVVIGAGAAGLTVGHLLRQKGFEIELLEANSNYGGRMKRVNGFADFPICTGAEWLHVSKNLLDEIVNDPEQELDVPTTQYDLETDYALVGGKRVSLKKVGFAIDRKFIASSWFDFFETWVVPNIKEKIQLNRAVQSIDYSSDKVVVQTKEEKYTADFAVITVPVKILQLGKIAFRPSLPANKSKAIEKATVWDGCKAFIGFSQKFYPAVTGFEGESESTGHRLYYDAAYGQSTSQHILGLFAVGSSAKPYLERSGDEQIKFILDELDRIFDGEASEFYVKHIFQNWTEEPWARGAYVHYFEDQATIQTLGASVADKLYFAGDAYTDGNEWSSVHAAARSAKSAVAKIVG